MTLLLTNKHQSTSRSW